jgi:hypothetical protein
VVGSRVLLRILLNQGCEEGEWFRGYAWDRNLLEYKRGGTTIPEEQTAFG